MSRNKKSTIHKAHDTDLQNVLEMLCYTNEIQLKIKVLSTMAGYILSKQINCKTIVTHQPLYEELQYVLSKSLSLSNMTTALYFIEALLSIDDVKGFDGTLKMHAQNALRISGCLATLVELFSRDMMYQDIWTALCRSVAETCRGSELNQSYCSFLVPVCVRKCRQGNMEAGLVLQSLLHNHDRNIQMFLDCDGTSIFTRNALQSDACLQLLDTVAQRSQRAATALVETDLIYHLRDYLHIYGRDSKIGQWATIIVYHINSWCTKDDIKSNNNGKGHVSEINENDSGENTHENDDFEPKNITRTLKPKDVTLNKHNINETKEVLQNVVREIAYRKLQNDNKNKTVKNNDRKTSLTNVSHWDNLDDTEELMQKIARELAYENMLSKRRVGNKQTFIDRQKDNAPAMLRNLVKQQCKPQKEACDKLQTTSKNFAVNGPRFYDNLEVAKEPRKNTFISQKSQVTARGNRSKRQSEDIHESELSFSFVLNEDKNTGQRRPDTDQNCFVAKPTLTTRQFSHNYKNAKMSRDKSTSQTLHSFNSVTNNTRNDEQSSTVNTRVFKPTFTSTPKHISDKAMFAPANRISPKIQESSRTSFKRFKASSASNLKSRRHLQPSRTGKPWNKSAASSVKAAVKKRQSMSARLFTAINESCTTFVKSVKGIFRVSANNTKNESKLSYKDENNNTSMCSFSFTNFMRKRDAAEANDGSKYGETEYEFSMEANSLNMNPCKTCNETTFLQQKLKNDENLKETIKKLKYGINLYGCDFKKISKALWPKDKFMTQQVLYNLYRKLLAK